MIITGGVSLELLEQQQAKEQTRLLQRFLEMRVQQKLQQERLMQQQQQQIDMLQGEQLLVQTLLATNKNGKQCDGRKLFYCLMIVLIVVQVTFHEYSM